MDGLLKWIDRRNFVSVRALTLYVTLWMTWEVTRWAFQFANATTLDGAQAGLMIGAVTLPVCALQGFVFRDYVMSRGSTQ